MLTTLHESPVKPKLLEKATARRTAHRVMAKKKRKGSDKKQKVSRSAQGKQRQDRRDGWTTRRRQVIKVPEGAVLRGCKKTRRKLREHLRLRAEIHSKLRVIASLFVLRIFLTCLSDSESESEPEPVTQPPPRRCSARLAALALAAPTGPPLPLDCEDPVMLRQLKDFCEFFANPNFKTCYNQLQRRLGRNRHPMLMPAFEDPSNQALLAKLQELGSINLAGFHNTIDAHSMQLAVAMQQHYSNPGKTLTCPPPFTLTPMARVGVHFIKVDSRVLHGVCKQLGLTKETRAAFTSEPALSHHWARWFNTNKLRNQGFAFERGIAELREFVFDPDTQTGVGIDPGVTQAVSAASGVWDPQSGQLMADQLRRWKLTKGQVKYASGLNNARRDTERWLAPIKPHLQHLAAASSAGTSLEANLKHITVTLATWDAVWEVYLDPKWARQRLRLYGAQERALEQFFNKLEEKMAELSMERHNHAKQLVVFFGAASIGTAGGWGAGAVLHACRKVVCRPRGTDQLRGRVVLVDEHRTTRVSSAVNGKQPCEVELNTLSATRPAGWKPQAGQVEQRLLRPAWSQQRDQPVRGMMWCPVVPPRKPPQAPRSSQEATPTAASEPGPSTPQPAKRSKRTKAEPGAGEPTKGKGKGKAAQPASMECDTDSDSESDCDSEPEPQFDSESESEPEPVTQPPPRRCSARLAALALAAPTGPPLPLDCEDPVMLRQLKDFCKFFANPNFKTCYNQLQRRLGRNRHPMLMPAFEDPSNQALLAKLQELGSINLAGFHNTIDAHSMQLAVAMQQHYSNPGKTLTCPPPFTLTPMARVGVHFIKVDCRVLHGVCKQLGLTKESRAAFTSEPALSHHWARWFNTNKLRNQGFAFERGIAELREFVFDPDTQTGVGIDPGVTQAVSAASGVWDPQSGQLMADQLRRWKLTKGQVKYASGLNNARRDTERWLAPIKPHLQHLAAASSAGTSLEANLKHITVTLATWDAVWEVYLDPKWARQRLRLYGAQERALEQFFNKLEEKMAELSMERHNHAKQLVVFFGAASIGTAGGWGAGAVLHACRKVVCRPRGTDQLRGRVVLVDEHRTTRVSSAVNGKQPCEVELNTLSATRPAGWKPQAGQVEQRLLRPAWSQQRDQPVRGMMWCPVVPPRKPPQAPRSSQEATPTAASEPGPSTPQPAKRSKRTKAEPGAGEPTKGKGKGKAAKAKPAPQPGRWLDRDCNSALNMQCIGESKWRPLELCYWPDQGALPAKGKEYPGLGYKRLRDKPPKAQQQQQQPAEAQ
ncbi:hypothetical protein QJQ45_008808 [Haematococcus lacustris]|nr:hypothetical protein QJQ45_008808 [Haematococcus lacustris]